MDRHNDRASGKHDSSTTKPTQPDARRLRRRAWIKAEVHGDSPTAEHTREYPNQPEPEAGYGESEHATFLLHSHLTEAVYGQYTVIIATS